ncbi:MAG: histidine--tRNA ligase [Ruminococcaceae bacterium]|nr:histidine--tRNA ligase [Oscillospiraceae bacterium]
MAKLTAPKGTKDVLPQDSYRWQYVESVLKQICNDFNFKEIRTPTFEATEVFARGVGDTTDVVTKEMYTFLDKGGRSITLRPEGTAGVARSFVENGLYAGVLPLKLFYLISCFRYEKPQAGRLREFHQFGVEMLGTTTPNSDAEAIIFGAEIFKRLNIGNITLNLNNIGCKECRKAYNEKLKAFLEAKKDSLCETCQERLGKNPMRIFDCKSEVCQSLIKDAPTIFDCVCDDCRDHFNTVTDILDTVGITYKIDKGIVRGLDYYSKTVFEFVSDNIGAQGTVLGGGRYDGLIADLGGNDAPGIGFAMGIERLLLLAEGAMEVSKDTPDVFLIPIGDAAKKQVYQLVYSLRGQGISAEYDLNARSVKAQMKYADKIGAKYTVVIGDDEIAQGSYPVKNMSNGETVNVAPDEIVNVVKA